MAAGRIVRVCCYGTTLVHSWHLELFTTGKTIVNVMRAMRFTRLEAVILFSVILTYSMIGIFEHCGRLGPLQTGKRWRCPS